MAGDGWGWITEDIGAIVIKLIGNNSRADSSQVCILDAVDAVVESVKEFAAEVQRNFFVDREGTLDVDIPLLQSLAVEAITGQ